MPSRSKKQQRLFGMIYNCQKTGKCASKNIEKLSNSISIKAAHDFASTKTKKLPTKIKKFKEWLEDRYPRTI